MSEPLTELGQRIERLAKERDEWRALAAKLRAALEGVQVYAIHGFGAISSQAGHDQEECKCAHCLSGNARIAAMGAALAATPAGALESVGAQRAARELRSKAITFRKLKTGDGNVLDRCLDNCAECLEGAAIRIEMERYEHAAAALGVEVPYVEPCATERLSQRDAAPIVNAAEPKP